ncbi:3'-5' exonuclease [Helicobacter vulpis]|uniref:3'-5' exonuclease n=1 Tax=Helicobacter vulpis TaxID=2316076 RepID=UPI000EAFF34A|nr:3'-5' exonuclease [Helicobacter vulpis]
MLCVLDIETVPDLERISRDLDPEWTLSPLELCAKAFEVQKAKSGSEFLPLYWHKVISIAAVLANAQGHFIKVGNFGKQEGHENEEKHLVGDFLEFFNHRKPMLVSFNGRNFDLPTLMLKALAYNLDAHAFYEQSNYRYRYSEALHTDLLDSLSQFGAPRLNLDGVCSMAGLPGKFGLSGERVHEIYYGQEDDRLDRIDNYCQADVLNTYWLYLKYILSKGELAKEHYLNILVEFKSKLPQDKPYSEVFTQALEREIQTEMQGD